MAFFRRFRRPSVRLLVLLAWAVNAEASAVLDYRVVYKGVFSAGAEMPIETVTYSLADGGKAFEALMNASSRPTAIICGNDVLAAGAIVKARELGLHVPADVSITGFDDIDLAEVVEPRLTTVHVPHRRMGEAAARMLLDIRDGKTQHQSIELETSIVMRDSLASV